MLRAHQRPYTGCAHRHFHHRQQTHFWESSLRHLRLARVPCSRDVNPLHQSTHPILGEHQTATPLANVTCATRASSAPAYVARAYTCSLRTGARQRCVILCIFLVILLYCVYETLLHDGRFQCYNIFSCRHHLRYIC